jgi:serine/threonine protein kinase
MDDGSRLAASRNLSLARFPEGISALHAIGIWCVQGMIEHQRWEQIKDLFDRALALSPEDRPPFLVAACGDDLTLRLEVERLLEHNVRAGSFLEGSPSKVFALEIPNPHLPTFKPGLVLSGRFQIVRFIGRGGMGEVYEARDLELGARIALKTLRHEISSNSWVLSRFKQEIQLARRVTHPNVCRTFDIEHHNASEIDSVDRRFDRVFLTMELLEGHSLAERLSRNGRMSRGEAWPIIQQMAEGLFAAHRAGVIHRDFKPSNVILTGAANGLRAVVTDFGLARAATTLELTAGHPAESLSTTGQLLGTFAYMAPEQLEGKEVTNATDVYALGLVIYEMLTGRSPFPKDAPLAGAFLRVKEQPPSPRTHVPEIDQIFEETVMQCLRTDPSERFQSTREVAASLVGAKADSSIGISSPTNSKQSGRDGGTHEETLMSPSSSAKQRPVWLAPKRLAALAVCLAAIAAGFAAYHLWLRPSVSDVRLKTIQISLWNKPINDAHLSPDGKGVAFDSIVNGIAQVFLMPTSGGEPIQLTHDTGDKVVNNFSSNGKEVFYGKSFGRDEVWAMPIAGGTSRHVAFGSYVLPSLDGSSIFYVKSDNSGIFRAERSGLSEELVFGPDGTYLFPALLFPGGDDLLTTSVRTDSPKVRISKLNLSSYKVVDLGNISNYHRGDITWAEPGDSILFSRTVGGLTNIWQYGFRDGRMRQITFGAGADYSPMPDPEGRGIYFVNGKSSAFLTTYNVRTKSSSEVASSGDATEPIISPDGKRLTYVTVPSLQNQEVWVSGIDGSNKVRVATGDLVTGRWAPDNFHLTYFDEVTGRGAKVNVVAADGSGLRQLSQAAGYISDSVWSLDQKFLFVTNWTGSKFEVWKWSLDGSTSEKILEGCSQASALDPSGKYLLGAIPDGQKAGVYEISLADKKCISLLPGVETTIVNFAFDGKSFLYAVASGAGVTIYRQGWRGGRLVGMPQVAFKIPFAFPLFSNYGSSYDFSSDLATIVYRRPGGYADLYLLSQK